MVVEIGAGTGRIAVPLAQAGVRVLGLDLSAPMLDQLVAKGSAVTALRADATAIPVRDGVADGSIEVLADEQTRDLKSRLGTKAEEFYPWLDEQLAGFVP